MAEQLSPVVGHVKLEAFTKIKAIPRGKKYEALPVLVRVTAPRSSAAASPMPDVDLVAVLDAGGGMRGDKLLAMQQAMEFVVGRLGQRDQLSVVSFNGGGGVQRCMELTEMSDGGRDAARSVVRGLEVAGGGSDDMGAALREATTILRERPLEKSTTRVGCVIFLSDGDDDTLYNQPVNPEFHAPTFSLDKQVDSKVVLQIGEDTSDIYSFFDNGIDKIKDAFATAVGGEMAFITAMNIHIDLQAHEDVLISSIKNSSGFMSRIDLDKRSSSIEIDNLRAGEVKNFIIYLTVEKDGNDNMMKVLSVSGKYSDPNMSNEETMLDESGVFITVLDSSSAKDEEISVESATERIRRRLLKSVDIDMENIGEMHNDNGADAHTMMLPWLMTHKWQPARTKISLHKDDAPQTGGIENLLNKKTDAPLVVDTLPSESPTSDKHRDQDMDSSESVTTWVRRVPFVFLLVLLTVYFSTHWSGIAQVNMFRTVDVDVSPNEKSWLGITTTEGYNKKPLIGTDISRVSKMQQSLLILQKLEQLELTSSFQDKPDEALAHALHQYLYMAILHDGVLRRRYASTPKDVDSTISMLKHKVEELEEEKKKLSFNIGVLMHDNDELKENVNTKCALTEKKVALEKANTRITELESQIQEKKASIEKSLLVVANSDSNLKTCGKKVGMLEAKVGELEAPINVNY